jgi:spore coat polysaccharide biosynthesis predicted glycosyltransferase SpsG
VNNNLKVAFRADASASQGAGHVVRSLTLARQFQKSGHEVCFFGDIENIPWLLELIHQSRILHVKSPRDSLDFSFFVANSFDLLVVDSYEVPCDDINAASNEITTLAIVDNDSRGIQSHFLLDHNLDATPFTSIGGSSQLIGPKFALVRDEMIAIRRSNSHRRNEELTPSVLVVSGGTDPTGLAVKVSQLISDLDSEFDLSFITNQANVNEVAHNLPRNSGNVYSQRPDIQNLLVNADIVISAAGTSVLDLSCIGIPTIYFSVAENQNANLAIISDLEIGLTMPNSANDLELKDMLQKYIRKCAFDHETREQLFQNSQKFVDGKGAQRVVEEIEIHLS